MAIAFIIYGIVIAGVGVNFPSGTIVVLVYTLAYGWAFLGGYKYYQFVTSEHKKIESSSLSDFFRYELCKYRLPIIDYYILSYTVALGLILIWIALVKSVDTTRSGY